MVVSTDRGASPGEALPWPVEAALRVVQERGLDELTMRRVAESAGKSPMAAYRHFADKDDLVRSVLREAFRIWESRAYAVLEVPEPEARLEAYARVYLRFALEEPQLYDLLFVRPHRFGIHRFPEGFRERPATTIQILRETVVELRRGQGLADDDPTEVAVGLWALVHGLVMIHRSGRFPDAAAEFEAVYVGRVRNAIDSIRRERLG